MAQAKQQATLGSLWEEASKRYKADLQRYDEEYESKHSHVWNIHHHKKPTEEIPIMYSAKDFSAELEKKKTDFKDMRMKAHGVFKAMNSLATPVEIIGGQAAAVGSMFNPAAPMVFGAVLYLFNAGRDVHESYNVLEVLFTKCTEAITDIASMVTGVRYLKVELQNVVIESLTAILDVFRIAASYAKSKRFKAYADALAHPGKGGPEKQSLERLKDLNKRRDTTVGIASLVGIDILDQKHDRTDRKIDVVSSTQTDILSQVTQVKLMFKEKTEDRTSPKRTIDAKQKSEDRNRKQLKKLLSPIASVTDRAKEFAATTAPGTCEWIFSEPEFENWKTQPDVPILWIYGDSGVGKSHLAAKIVEHSGSSHLLGDKETERAVVAAYFVEYEDGDTEENEDSAKTETTTVTEQKGPGIDGKTNESTEMADKKADLPATADPAPTEVTSINGQPLVKEEDVSFRTAMIADILRTMAWQLAEDDKKYEKFLTDHLRATEENCQFSRAITDVWNYLFNKYFASIHDRFLTLVIDGIDNLVEGAREVFYDLLKDVVRTFKESGNGPIRFICLSQPTLKVEITKAFSSNFQIPSITVTKERNLRDIETYISWTVDQSPKLKRVLKDQAFRQETVTKLAGCTNGVFEMGALLLKQLAQKDHVDLFSEVLEKPPTDIQAILKETLEHFGDTHTVHDIKDLNTLLSWVLYAEERLSLAWLNAAIGLESGHGEFLDIRDKIGREFSAYFSIVDLRDRDEPAQPTKLPVEVGTVSLLGTGVDVATEKPAEDQNDDDLDIPGVKVAHASIAKFFRNAEISSITEKNTCIGVGRNEAHLRLAKTCLRVICYKPEEDSKPWKSMSTTEKLLLYATTWFDKHLKAGKAAATVADKVETFRLLAKLFRDETVISRWVRETGFWSKFFDMNESLGIVWSWFSDEDALNELTDEEKKWVVEPCPSTAERVLKPIAMWYAKNWLQDPTVERNEDAMYFFVYLRSLIQLFERSKETPMEPTEEKSQPADVIEKPPQGSDPPKEAHETPSVTKETPPDGEAMSPEASEPEKEKERVETPIYGEHPFDEAWKLNGDADAIRKVAEWAGFEKTALWHCRVGYNVADLANPLTEASLLDFQTALKIDPDFGAAQFFIAKCYGDDLKQYDVAISHMEEARRVNYNESGGSVRRAAVWIAKWQEEKAAIPGASDEAKNVGRQEAMKTLEAALKKYPGNFDLVAAYIGVAGRSGKHKAVMSQLLSLDAKLPDFLRSEDAFPIHRTLRRAAQNTRRVGVLKRTYEMAIATGKPKLGDDGVYTYIDLLNSLANLFVENQEDDKAIDQYQTLIEYADDMDVSFYAVAGSNRVALLYLLTACSKGSTEKEKKKSLENLVKLEKEERDPDNKVMSDVRSMYGLILGFYYKLIGEHDKAQSLFKDRVELAMTLLDDDDADNDFQAWEILSYTLFKAGDLENGRAATAIWYKELRKMIGERDDSEKTGAPFGEKQENSEIEAVATDAEANGTAKPTPTQIASESIPNESADPVNASSEKAEPVNSTSIAKAEPEQEPTYEDTPWQMGTCDGICDRDLKDYDKGIHICIYCTTMCFCVECWEKHRESPLPHILCDSDHEFVYVTGPPKKLGDDKIKVGEKIRDRAEWLNEIRGKWGLPLKEKVVEVKEEVKEEAKEAVKEEAKEAVANGNVAA